MTTFKQKTYLFLPLETGIAHITRSLVLAEELHTRGHRVIFAIPERKKELTQFSSVEIVYISTVFSKDEEVIAATAHMHLERWILTYLNIHSKLIDTYAPDAVVVDGLFAGMFSAQMKNKKIFALYNSQYNPYGFTYPDLTKNGVLNYFLRFLLPIFWKVRLSLHTKDAIKLLKQSGQKVGLRTWLDSADFIIPEPSFYFPSSLIKQNVHFVGPLRWGNFIEKQPDWINSIHKDGRTIYVSFGGTGFSENVLFELVRTLLSRGYRVIVTTGTVCRPEDIPNHENLYTSRFLPSIEISSRVDLTICHGGYGTMLDSIHAGTPVVATPFNPDQMLHALRMQELGCARTTAYFRLIDIFNAITLRWSAIQDMCEQIPISHVITMVEEVLASRKSYQKNIEIFNSKYPNINGVIEASNIIESNTL